MSAATPCAGQHGCDHGLGICHARSPTLPSVPLDENTARALTRAAKQAATWTDKRNQLIREAVAAGGGVREVARAVGLNHATVLNIVKPRQR